MGGAGSVSVIGADCCGCGACEFVCPKGCVRMEPDGAGFRYPSVDDGACVSCGRCLKTCPVAGPLHEAGVRKALWAINKNADELERSSSGGVFCLLAEDTYRRGGAVYGAAFAPDFKSVRHIRTTGVAELGRIMGSKYVQSTVSSDVYRQIEEDLRAGAPVLFAGTGCQVSAIVSAMAAKGVDRGNLLAVDVICHGVPAPKLWALWASHKERHAGERLQSMAFRDKAIGWPAYCLAYGYARQKDERVKHSHDWYFKAFLNNVALRASCFNCPSRRHPSSDVTLGDYWGVQRAHPDLSSDMGVSAVILNTEKGQEAVAAISESLNFGATELGEIVKGNPSLVEDERKPGDRDEFIAALVSGTSVEGLRRRWPFERTPLQTLRILPSWLFAKCRAAIK